MPSDLEFTYSAKRDGDTKPARSGLANPIDGQTAGKDQ